MKRRKGEREKTGMGGLMIYFRKNPLPVGQGAGLIIFKTKEKSKKTKEKTVENYIYKKH